MIQSPPLKMRDNTMVETQDSHLSRVRNNNKCNSLMIEKLDLFSRPIPTFTVKGRSTISSPLGFLVSIAILVTIIIFAAATVIEFFQGNH